MQMGNRNIRTHFWTLIITLFFGVYCASTVLGQSDTLTVFETYRLAEQNYPALKNDSLLRAALALKIENFNTRYLPQLTAQANASYQSDVVSFPFTLPGDVSLDLPREHWQAYVQVDQLIYDGGAIVADKALAEAESNIERNKFNTSLRYIQEQVVKLYFALALGHDRRRVIQNTREVLIDKQGLLQSAFEGGIADRADVLSLQAEIVQVEKQLGDLDFALAGSANALAIITGIDINAETPVRIPDLDAGDVYADLNRPDLDLFDAHRSQLDAMWQLREAQRRPKLGVFAQAGAGYPNKFNFFDDATTPFYLFGAHMTWNFTAWGGFHRDRQVFDLQSQMIAADKRSLELSIHANLTEQAQDIAKYRQALEKDQELKDLRKEIRVLVSQQLDEGIVGTNAFIDAVHDEQAADLNFQINAAQLAWTRARFLLQQGTLFPDSNQKP